MPCKIRPRSLSSANARHLLDNIVVLPHAFLQLQSTLMACLRAGFYSLAAETVKHVTRARKW